MDASYASNITEFAIVLAGFSGLVITIGSKDGSSNPLTKHRTFCLLSLSFAAAFGSLLPTLALSFGISKIWTFSSYALSCILLATVIGAYLSTRLLLNEEERKKLRGYMYVLILWVNVFLVFLLALMPAAGHFFIALVWQLIVSAILFTRLILQS
ncbi:hypothetical protein OAL54_06940 [Gammaproteobacteria bacterium]|nr:hypothetical protein [Gammaproteobacteria bacterium]